MPCVAGGNAGSRSASCSFILINSGQARFCLLHLQVLTRRRPLPIPPILLSLSPPAEVTPIFAGARPSQFWATRPGGRCDRPMDGGKPLTPPSHDLTDAAAQQPKSRNCILQTNLYWRPLKRLWRSFASNIVVLFWFSYGTIVPEYHWLCQS